MTNANASPVKDRAQISDSGKRVKNTKVASSPLNGDISVQTSRWGCRFRQGGEAAGGKALGSRRSARTEPLAGAAERRRDTQSRPLTAMC
jgi:hypothetical protein